MLKEPLDSLLLADFVAALDPINALADASPGFVWRLQTEDGDATAVRAFGDDRLIVNLSVWQSVETLSKFVFRSAHADVMRRRRKWFERMREVFLVLWWVPLGHTPTTTEAEERMDRLRRLGPTPEAFDFKHLYAAPDGVMRVEPVSEWNCPV